MRQGSYRRFTARGKRRGREGGRGHREGYRDCSLGTRVAEEKEREGGRKTEEEKREERERGRAEDQESTYMAEMAGLYRNQKLGKGKSSSWA